MKPESKKVQIRKRALEYCILLQLENKPLHVCDILEMAKKSKMIVNEEAHPSLHNPTGNYYYTGDKSENSLNQTPGNKVHLLWLLTGFLYAGE